MTNAGSDHVDSESLAVAVVAVAVLSHVVDLTISSICGAQTCELGCFDLARYEYGTACIKVVAGGQ